MTRRSPFLALAEAAEAIAAECRALSAAGADLDLPTNAILLSTREAAEAMSCSEDTIGDLVRQGELPVVHFGRAVRIPRDALVEWVAANAATKHVRVLKRSSA